MMRDLFAVVLVVVSMCCMSLVGAAQNNAAWANVAYTTSQAPPVICDHRSVPISASSFVTYGGGDYSDDYFVQDDLWKFDVETRAWEILEPSSVVRPHYRAAPVFAHDPIRNRLVLANGYSWDESYGNEAYLNDVWTFDLSSHTWQDAYNSSEFVYSSSGYTEEGGVRPEGRGWGTMSVTDSVGIVFSGLGIDSYLDDMWVLDLDTLTYSTPYATVCTNRTLCVDQAQDGFDFTNSSCVLDRPEFIPSQQEVFAAAVAKLANASVPLIGVNVTCTTTCEGGASQFLGDAPSPRDGFATAVVGDAMYLFGGYSCIDRTPALVMIFGGLSCFDDTMYMLNLTSYVWTAIPPPALNDSSSEYVPVGRSYHTMTAHEGKLWITGGAFLNILSDITFFNDVAVFNTLTLEWEGVHVVGTPPVPRWGHSATLMGSDLFVFAGCTANEATSYFNDMHALKLNLQLGAQHVRVVPAATTWEAVAGQEATVVVQLGDWTVGETWEWANGMRDEFDVLMTETVNGQSHLTQGSCTAIGNGRYSFSAQAKYGPMAQVYIWFGGDSIAGSPFTVNVVAQEESLAHFSLAGAGLEMTQVRRRETEIVITRRDQFLNLLPAVDGDERWVEVDVSFPLAIELGADNVASLDAAFKRSLVTSVRGDNLVVSYTVPDQDIFNVTVLYKGHVLYYSTARALHGEAGTVAPRVVLSVSAQSTLLALLLLLLISISIGSVFLVKHRHCKSFVTISVPPVVGSNVGSVLMLVGLFTQTLEFTPVTCTATTWLLQIGYTVALVPLLLKFVRLRRIFGSMEKGSTRIFTSNQQILLGTAFASVALSVYLLIWSLVAPFALNPHGQCVAATGTESVHLGLEVALLAWDWCLLLSLSAGIYSTSGLPRRYNESVEYGFAVVVLIVLGGAGLAIWQGENTEYADKSLIGVSFGIVGVCTLFLATSVRPMLAHARKRAVTPWMQPRTLKGTAARTPSHTVGLPLGGRGGSRIPSSAGLHSVSINQNENSDTDRERGTAATTNGWNSSLEAEQVTQLQVHLQLLTRKEDDIRTQKLYVREKIANLYFATSPITAEGETVSAAPCSRTVGLAAFRTPLGTVTNGGNTKLPPLSSPLQYPHESRRQSTTAGDSFAR